jgi:biotin synthase-like enzyme
MEFMKQLWNYLTTLEWTERVQENCKFCDQSNFASIAYEVSRRFWIEREGKQKGLKFAE